MALFAVIMVAAGKARRFQQGRDASGGGIGAKKPFVPLAGRPVFLHSVEMFARMGPVRQIILVVAPEDREEVAEKFAKPLATFGVELVAGGTERFDSVENGLRAVRPEIGFIAIHDAARPCVTQRLVESVFDAAIRTGAAVPASKIVGTVKRAVASDADSSPARKFFIESTVPRDVLWEAETPQVFRRDLYEKAVAGRGHFTPTDDASLLERLNFPVEIVESDRTNPKITTHSDLAVAEMILAGR